MSKTVTPCWTYKKKKKKKKNEVDFMEILICAHLRLTFICLYYARRKFLLPDTIAQGFWLHYQVSKTVFALAVTA